MRESSRDMWPEDGVLEGMGNPYPMLWWEEPERGLAAVGADERTDPKVGEGTVSCVGLYRAGRLLGRCPGICSGTRGRRNNPI